MDTARSRRKSLLVSALSPIRASRAHKVVAFIVKVRVLLKVVNSQVGRVSVTNAASHTKNPGMKLMIR